MLGFALAVWQWTVTDVRPASALQGRAPRGAWSDLLWDVC